MPTKMPCSSACGALKGRCGACSAWWRNPSTAWTSLSRYAAVRAALDKVGLILLEDHTRGCVARAIKNSEGDADAAISELTDVLRHFLR